MFDSNFEYPKYGLTWDLQLIFDGGTSALSQVLTRHYQQKGIYIKRRKPLEIMQKLKGTNKENNYNHNHQ
jgi:hypothetical protein